MDLLDAARRIVASALEAVNPLTCVRQHLDRDRDVGAARRVLVIGAGKASAAMAEKAEEILGDRIERGWVNTKRGHGAALRRVRCQECGHPVPDAAGLEGARQIAEIAKEAGEGDLVLFLLSGGASALLPLPAQGVSLSDKQAVTRLLLQSGADIQEMNAVRKHLSSIKGGRLARLAAPARVLSLILSDVVGDDLGTIGSGPTAPDASTFEDARNVLKRRKIWDQAPETVRQTLERGEDETPKPGSPIFDNVSNRIVGNNRQALEAARNAATGLGFHTLLLSSTVTGETRDIARVHASILREICQTGQPVRRPACIITGGETTVTVRGSGKGGRNQEFALAAALELQGLTEVLALSFGTDGTDGSTDAAGAFADESTVRRAEDAGLDARGRLDNNDSYPVFKVLGDLIVTGPTRTNVMDIHLLLAR